jgi:hypothetical protein
MANYNSHLPAVVGDEWVPIRQANYLPDDITERGYVWHIDHGHNVVSGGYSIADVQPAFTVNTAFMQHIYAADTEDLTGPIQQVVIPVESVTVTGDNTISSGATPWLRPNDSAQSFMYPNMGVGPTINSDGFGLSFNVAGFSNELSNKRILDVELLYSVNGDPLDLARVSVALARAWNSHLSEPWSFVYQVGLEGPPEGVPNTDIKSIHMTGMNPLWLVSAGIFGTSEVFPWRYTELALLDSSATPANAKLQISLQWADQNFEEPFNGIFFNYAALRVTYCEERRLLYGGRRTNENGSSTGALEVVGTSIHRFFTPSFVQGAVLGAGDYVITNTFESLSTVPIVDDDSAGVNTQTPPTLSALRQLYEIPAVRGVVVSTSLIPNDEFVSAPTDIIPGIWAYTPVGIVTGSHAYATQVVAPVYSGISATQDLGPGDGSAASVPLKQIRFYARRFGAQSGPLTVTFDPSGVNQILCTVSDEELDALDEIVDGWREVTKAITTVTSSSTFLPIQFSSGTSASTRWEILAATGASGTTYATGPASFNPPLGTSLTLVYKAPNQASATEDTNGDATVMLSQTPLAVTGFATSQCTLDVEGIGTRCGGVVPGCIPTAIYGMGLDWSIGSVYDDYDRRSTSTWTTATTGQAWSHFGAGGSVLNSQFTVDGDFGEMLVPQANASRASYLSTFSGRDVEVMVSFRASAPIVSGSTLEPAGIMLRGTGLSSFYLARVFVNTNHSMTVKLYNPSGTELANVTVLNTYYEANVWYRLRVRIHGYSFRAKLWRVEEDEPDGWSATTTDSTSYVTGWVGVISGITSGNLNAPQTFEYDDLCVVPAEIADGAVEIQRMDDFEDWQTIYLASPCGLPEFCDYEARVGVTSSYRIRTVNGLDFPGDWSVTVTGSIASPGVDGVTGKPGALIFTSNQDSASSLAYMEVFDRNLEEQFSFAEAGFQELRTQYGRDYFIAFRPTERGGEQFTRTILVQSAAIPPISLGNFNTLRDLAWQDLPYICVRDELGNRWFANVLVPGGNVRRNRRLYLAQVTITEVTDTPAPYTGA